jgi:lactate dehydrogenase-like 2-hydroxyacid dehydrogenase
LLLTRRWPEVVEADLCSRYTVTLNADDRRLTSEELVAAMRSYDVLCPTVSDRIDAAVIATPSASVRLIANYGAGVDHIDLAAARAAGILVSNTPDVLTDSTAELAVLLMLMVSRRAGEGERELRAGRWAGWRPMHMMGQSLAGKRLGLVGFGRIGQGTARRAVHALGMRIAYHSRRRMPAEVEAEFDAEYFPSLEALAAASDVLSLHCNGGAETRHLINAQILAGMKRSALLINTARGSVIDERALATALASGLIAGAGLDVYEREPAVDQVLLGIENVVLLPHLGSATLETRVAMGRRTVANIDRFLAGQALLDRVV